MRLISKNLVLMKFKMVSAQLIGSFRTDLFYLQFPIPQFAFVSGNNPYNNSNQIKTVTGGLRSGLHFTELYITTYTPSGVMRIASFLNSCFIQVNQFSC